MNGTTLIQIATFSLILGSSLPLSTHAVGPYMENERPPGPRVEGPVPDLVPPTAVKPPILRQAVVRGEVLRIEGEYYVVKDATGSEVSLRVNNDTRMDTIPKLGDKIEAEVTPQFQAETIKAVKRGE
jgi:hypothetical protein